MKHGVLRAAVQNVAASLASGMSTLTGFYTLDLYGDAARSRNQKLTVDFITGRIVEGRPQSSTVLAARKSKAALRHILKQSNGSIDDLLEANATYYANRTFTVTITDASGKQTTGDYRDYDGRRVSELDSLGRIRRRPLRRSH